MHITSIFFQKTAITHAFVTLKTLLKSEVTLDIIFKCLIQQYDKATTKMGEKCL